MRCTDSPSKQGGLVHPISGLEQRPNKVVDALGGVATGLAVDFVAKVPDPDTRVRP